MRQNLVPIRNTSPRAGAVVAVAPPEAAFLAQLIGDMLAAGRHAASTGPASSTAASSKKGAARGNALKIDRLV